MDQVEKIIFAIFGGIITVAIVSVIVGKNSRAPEAISATGSFLSNIVGAAVAPINTANTNGNLGQNTFNLPHF